VFAACRIGGFFAMRIAETFVFNRPNFHSGLPNHSPQPVRFTTLDYLKVVSTFERLPCSTPLAHFYDVCVKESKFLIVPRGGLLHKKARF
jgi:hypothetical protein